MARIITNIAFWSFQIINTITACLMTFIPKQFHESLFKNPEAVYEKLSFSAIAVEMVHNIIRGHGAVLVAISIFIWIERMKSRSVYLLISIVCALSVYAHIMTLHQHLKTAEIVSAIGQLWKHVCYYYNYCCRRHFKFCCISQVGQMGAVC